MAVPEVVFTAERKEQGVELQVQACPGARLMAYYALPTRQLKDSGISQMIVHATSPRLAAIAAARYGKWAGSKIQPLITTEGGQNRYDRDGKRLSY